MTYQSFSVFSGLISMLLFHFEQSLNSWILHQEKNRPFYDGNRLEVLAIMSEKLKAHQKSIRNVRPVVIFLRWAAISAAVFSQCITLLKDQQ